MLNLGRKMENGEKEEETLRQKWAVWLLDISVGSV